MARPLKPLVKSGGYYPSRKWTPLVYAGGRTTMADVGGGEPIDPLNTFSGAIASFKCSEARPLVDLTVGIEPVQSGSGDPSPSNIRPISGWAGATVTRTGKNLCGEAFKHGIYATINGTYYSHEGAASRYVSIGIIPVKGGQTYTFSWLDDSGNTASTNSVAFFKGNEFVSGMTMNSKKQISVPENADGIAINLLSTTNITSISQISISNPQLELGSTATAYEEFRGNSCSVTWEDEVFGGSAEVVEGKLSDDRWVATYDGTEAWYTTGTPTETVIRYYLTGQLPAQGFAGGVQNALSSIAKVSDDDQALNVVNTFHVRAFPKSEGWVGFAVDKTMYPTVADFKALLSSLYQNGTPVQVVAVTVHPVETTITPTPITVLKGYNVVWSDAGTVEVTAYGTPIVEPDVQPLPAMNLLLGGAYRNNHTPEDVSDEEALNIITGGADR